MVKEPMLKLASTKQKICKQCRYYQGQYVRNTQNTANIFIEKCKHPSTHFIDIISGENFYSDCYEQRANETKCGEEGKLFEEYPTEDKKKKGFFDCIYLYQ